MSNTQEIRAWYNNFSKNQAETGVNVRHYKIMNELIEAGLKKNATVLEVGCGIGTLTGLLNKYLSSGKLVATDISNESVEKAKQRIAGSSKIDFFVTDMSDFTYQKKFDFIIMPDVLEHIPVEQHKNLFACFERNMHDNSIVFIHVPHPRAIEFIRKYTPEKLQIIDQSIEADPLIPSVYSSNLTLISYTPYNLFHKENDYFIIQFSKKKFIEYTQLSDLSITKSKWIEKLKFFFSSF